MRTDLQRGGRPNGRRRTRAMAYREHGSSWGRRQATLLSSIAVLVLLAVVGASGMFGRGAEGSVDATPSQVLSARQRPAAVGPAATIAQRSTPPPTDPIPSARPMPTRTPASVPTATPSATATVPGGAPRSAAEFGLRRQGIDMGFPLRRQTRYHYRDNYLNRREGPPNEYNHLRVGRNGETIRLHDGIDIYAREGVPVVSPFDGAVIDPREKWAPWVPERYGRTVAIVSEEPRSAGYIAILVHLDERWVDIGQQVSRGQVIGLLGSTGNAEGGQPHLHFELRAPFLIDWSPLGEERLVDAFNPFRSLRRADPHR